MALKAVASVGPSGAFGQGLSSILAKFGIPFIVPPSGTMANNGAFTLGTALSFQYPSCFMWFATGQIQAASAQGWYYTTMQSTTAATVFNNAYTSGIPSIPVSPTAFVTTGPGATTGVITALIGPQITIPGGSVGVNGVIRTSMLSNIPNNANAKTLTLTIGASTFVSTSLASVGAALTTNTIFNQGTLSEQGSMPAASNIGVGTAAGNTNHNALNFANAQTLSIGLQLGVATDYQVLEGVLVEVMA